MTGLAYVAALIVFLWGIAHLIPVNRVVKGFGEISEDNRNIIKMEWLMEGVTLLFIGILIGVVTLFAPGEEVTITVYWLVVVTLNAMALISFLTGFKADHIAYKLCPAVLSGASVILMIVATQAVK